MNSEHIQASLLAEWLDGPPGQPAPEALDPDVVEALYALRPELAPAPRADFVLAGLLDGAAAKPSEATDATELLVQRPAGTLQDEETLISQETSDLAPDFPVQNLARFPGARPASAAASEAPLNSGALLDLFPFAHVTEPARSPAPADPVAPADPAEPAAPSSEDTSDESTPVFEEPEATDDDPTPVEDLPLLGHQETTDPSIGRSAGGLAADSGGEVVDLAAVRRRRFQTAASASLFLAAAMALIAVAMPELSPLGASLESPVMRSEPAPAVAAAPAEQLLSDAFGQADSGRATASMLGGELAEPEAEATVAARAPAAEPAGPVAGYQDIDGPADLATAAAKARAAAEANRANSRTATAVADATISLNYSEELKKYKATAWPRDYIDDWYLQAVDDELVLNRINQANQAVETYLRTFEFAEAATACESLIHEQDIRVAQDFAFRAARYAQKANDYPRALQLVHQGQQRSSANSPFLANLYAMEGQLQEQEREDKEALAAYKTAATLNAAR